MKLLYLAMMNIQASYFWAVPKPSASFCEKELKKKYLWNKWLKLHKKLGASTTLTKYSAAVSHVKIIFYVWIVSIPFMKWKFYVWN